MSEGRCERASATKVNSPHQRLAPIMSTWRLSTALEERASSPWRRKSNLRPQDTECIHMTGDTAISTLSR